MICRSAETHAGSVAKARAGGARSRGAGRRGGYRPRHGLAASRQQRGPRGSSRDCSAGFRPGRASRPRLVLRRRVQRDALPDDADLPRERPARAGRGDRRDPGAAEAAASVMRLAFGRISDRTAGAWPFVVAGEHDCRAGQAADRAGPDWPLVLAASRDRLGKGMRTPRATPCGRLHPSRRGALRLASCDGLPGGRGPADRTRAHRVDAATCDS